MYSVKNQVTDEKQYGGKLEAEDKEKILAIIKEKQSWFDSNEATATKEDFEEQKAEVEAVVNPITAKFYQGGSGGGSSATDSDEDMPNHDEL